MSRKKSYRLKTIKGLLKKYFESLAFFYSYLRYRILIVLGLSLLIGVLDGFGLTLFLPLLQMVSDASEVNPESLGKLKFLLTFIQKVGVPINLISILIFMVLFFFGKGMIQYLSGVYTVNIQQWFVKNLRIKNIRALNNIKYEHFVTADIGRIQNTLTGEVTKVSNSFLNYFKAFQYGILVIVYMVFAFTIDAQFAVLVTFGGILTNFLYSRLYKHTKAISRTLTGENSFFQSLVIQNVANYKYLKSTSTISRYGKKLERSAKEIERQNKKIGRLDALLTAGREPILISVIVVVIIIQTLYFESALASVLISLIFFYRALGYLMQMQVRWNKFLGLSGSLENIQSFKRELHKNREREGSIKLEEMIKEIELKDIFFSYGDKQNIKGLSLVINSNEVIAFVGESGSGKTTLVNLIVGLLTPDKGELRVNGILNSELSIPSFQKKIGYITQDPVVFNDTIFNNISFWSEKTEEHKKRFWEVIEKAALTDFVLSLPEKENTILGNQGVNLSGGQRQRISIARELFKEVELLVLDEATSALDSETEKSIQESIDALKGKYIILIVAHRISTIKNADKIVLMKDGQISNVSNFDNLKKESSYFHKLVQMQKL